MIQIDMKMPEHCVDCPFTLDNCCLVLGKYISLKQWAKGGIQKWCPLEEWEAVKPILTPWIVNDDGEVTVYKMECGKCGVQFYYEDQKYCSECGTPILWEGR